MANAKEERNERRIQIRLSVENWDRLQEMARRYGMSANQLCSFAVGKWLDDNYRTQVNMENMFRMMAQESSEKMESMAESPEYMAVIEKVMMMLAQNEIEKKGIEGN